MSRGPSDGVLGVRFYACARCEAVHALPDQPTACAECGATRLDDVTDRLGDAGYFAPPRPGE